MNIRNVISVPDEPVQ
ncbi:DUF2689 domain-containing protein, partial [Salmonella enterica]|nr:DUF2689 domain-containing protein [Salmonella enterica]